MSEFRERGIITALHILPFVICHRSAHRAGAPSPRGERCSVTMTHRPVVARFQSPFPSGWFWAMSPTATISGTAVIGPQGGLERTQMDSGLGGVWGPATPIKIWHASHVPRPGCMDENSDRENSRDLAHRGQFALGHLKGSTASIRYL